MELQAELQAKNDLIAKKDRVSTTIWKEHTVICFYSFEKFHVSNISSRFFTTPSIQLKNIIQVNLFLFPDM